MLADTGGAPSKTPILTKCNETIKAFNDYNTSLRRKQPKFDAKKRIILLLFKETIQTTRREAHLSIGGQERADGSYTTYDDFIDEKLYEMYRKR